MFSTKIKLTLKKEPSGDLNAQQNAAKPPIDASGGVASAAVGAQPGQQSSIAGGTSSIASPKSKKTATPAGSFQSMPGQPSMHPSGTTLSSSKGKQLKRSAGAMMPVGSAAGTPSAGGTAPKKLKLVGSIPLTLKTTGTLKVAGASLSFPHATAPLAVGGAAAAAAASSAVGSPLSSSMLPGGAPLPPPGPPGPKKRGRKPKSDPDSAANKAARFEMMDEVVFNIPAPPPRETAKRKVVTQEEQQQQQQMQMQSPGAEGPETPLEVGEYIPPDFPEPRFPLTGPTKEELLKLIARVREKDTKHLFHKPVTEAEVSIYIYSNLN